jgi:DNA-binding MarR family transcriptional regulator
VNTTISVGAVTATLGLEDPAEPGQRAALTAAIISDSNAIAARQRCAVARRLHRRGISMTHLHVLWALREHGDLSVTRLADVLGVAVPNATGLVDRMEQRGLVERDRDRTDRRVVIIRPTEAGIAAAEEIDGWRTDLLVRLLDRLDTDQLERIAGAISDIRAAPADAGPPCPAT